MENSLRIAVVGLGTVGCSVVDMLQKNGDLIALRAERRIEIVAVSARDKNKKRSCSTDGYLWADDPMVLPTLSNVDVVVEVVGGAEGFSYDLARLTLQNGKNYVTANKALLATHGAALAQLAEAHGVRLMFEAAVAGGIPIIKTVREALAGNKVRQVRGILNGTCNYILSRMTREDMEFGEALRSAQAIGFAEADPAMDIDGIDTAHKLALLSAFLFGVTPNLAKISVNGIRQILPQDLQIAAELGYRIKLLGVAKTTKDGIIQSVGPCLVPDASPLSSVEAEMNAVLIDGDYVGPLMLTGCGAGSGPTASAVIADLIDLARGTRGRTFSRPAGQLHESLLTGETEVESFYIRLLVHDVVGVMADVSAALRDCGVSIESLIQRGHHKDLVPLVVVTHAVRKDAIEKALAMIAKIPSVAEEPLWLRIEKL